MSVVQSLPSLHAWAPLWLVQAELVHMSKVHTLASLQVVPQLPQLSKLVVRSTHAPLHEVSLLLQLAWQVPSAHTSLPVHTVLHAPQWLGSLFRSTQLPSQAW